MIYVVSVPGFVKVGFAKDPADPCSQCDRASRYLGKSGQPLCREHARIHFGIGRRPRRVGRIGRNPAEVLVLAKWRGGAA